MLDSRSSSNTAEAGAVEHKASPHLDSGIGGTEAAALEFQPLPRQSATCDSQPELVSAFFVVCLPSSMTGMWPVSGLFAGARLHNKDLVLQVLEFCAAMLAAAPSKGCRPRGCVPQFTVD